MEQQLSYFNISQETKVLMVNDDNGRNMPLVTIGAMSYLSNALVSFDSAFSCHILIGKYTTIAREISINLAPNHAYKEVSTYPFDHILSHEYKKIATYLPDDDISDIEDVAEHRAAYNRCQLIIGNDVWIGAGVRFVGAVKVGNGAIIGAGSVITRDVPAYAVVAGNPARVLHYRFNEATIRKLQYIKWWNWPLKKIKENLPLMKDLHKFTVRYFNVSLTQKNDESLAAQIAGFKKLGMLIFYFVPDIGYPYPLWPKVVAQYMEIFSKKNALMIIHITEGLSEQPEAKKLEEICASGGKDGARVVQVNSQERFSRALIQETDYYITTRTDVSSECIDYADIYDSKVLSGLEYDVFSDFKEDGDFGGALSGDTIFTDELFYSQQQWQFESELKSTKEQIKEYIVNNKYEEALNSIFEIAGKLYDYNQNYVDEELETDLKQILTLISGNVSPVVKVRNNTVLFYDGFGMDNRGLARIYLQALCKLGKRIIYVVPEYARNKIPLIIDDLAGYDSAVYYIPANKQLPKYHKLCEIIEKESPSIAFLYIYPNDAGGVMAFEHYAGIMERYQINLTDDAFWIGKYALDYCLEFRDYGASLSRDYRGISSEKLLINPFYPVINKQTIFQGYPFKRVEGDVVIFSGGSIYKTIDEEGTYYNILEYIINSYPYVKVWYAGYDADSTDDNFKYMKELLQKYPEQFFATPERADLMQIMENVDLYLNTIPVWGGLMTQYAAAAGKVPLTYKGDLTGMLTDVNKLNVSFSTLEEYKQELERLIKDEDYRSKRGELMRQSVYNEELFVENLQAILSTHKSKYKINYVEINDEADKKDYFYRYFKRDKI